MLTHAQILQHLNALKRGPAWRQISAETGIQYNYLTKLARGQHAPSLHTAERLSAALLSRIDLREAA